MSSRRYHGELTGDRNEDPWLDDQTTAPYGERPRRTASGSQPISRNTPAWHTTGQWRTPPQELTVQQHADAEIALFWHEQDEAARAEITNRRLEPRWMRALAVLVGSLMCGVFARVLLMPTASLPNSKRDAQPSAASAAPATLRIDSQPWSQVFVDDVPLGRTPQDAVQLQPGQHNVRLYNPERNLLKILTLSAQPGESIERVEQLEK